MTIRRSSPMKPSRGTVIPPSLRSAVYIRDGHRCAGPRAGMPGECQGSGEIDHIRASGALGMKSRTELDNLVYLCAFHHRLKTEHGKEWRPVLIAYLEAA